MNDRTVAGGYDLGLLGDDLLLLGDLHVGDLADALDLLEGGLGFRLGLRARKVVSG